MINLPHTLDLISIDVPSNTYRFSGRSSTRSPQPGTYVSGPFMEGGVGSPDTIETDELYLSKTDANGRTLTLTSGVRYTIKVRSSFNGSPVTVDFKGGIRDETGYYNLDFTSTQDEWPAFDEDIYVTVSPYGIAPITTIAGSLVQKIKANVSPLTRSLDEQYDERYMVLTNYEFVGQRENLWLMRVGSNPTGFRPELKGIKIERVQSFPGFSQVICLAYPDSIVTPALDIEPVNYVDSDGSRRTIDISRIQQV